MSVVYPLSIKQGVISCQRCSTIRGRLDSLCENGVKMAMPRIYSYLYSGTSKCLQQRLLSFISTPPLSLHAGLFSETKLHHSQLFVVAKIYCALLRNDLPHKSFYISRLFKRKLSTFSFFIFNKLVTSSLSYQN